MKPFVVSPHASDDLDEIWLYLAENASEQVADDALRRLVKAFSRLAEDPGIGHRRRDLTHLPLHFFFVEPYMIIYGRDQSPLAVHSVLHGARDLRTVLRGRPL